MILVMLSYEIRRRHGSEPVGDWAGWSPPRTGAASDWPSPVLYVIPLGGGGGNGID